MKPKYIDEDVERFLKKIWHKANYYEQRSHDNTLTNECRNRFEKRCYRLRKFYASIHKCYKAKQRENSGNYVFKK